MSAERWRPIDGTAHAVSDMGRIRRALPGPSTRTGRILSGSTQRDGYVLVNLSRHGKTRAWLLHRLVAHAFLGPCPQGKECNHKNGDKLDNRAANIEYLTRAENMQHAQAAGLLPHYKGGQHPNAKLTNAAARSVKAAMAGGATASVVARKHGVSKSTVYAIVSGQNWGHL